MIKLFFFLSVGIPVFSSYFQSNLDLLQSDISIRIVNQSTSRLENVYIYSVRFDNIKLNEKSKYVKLNFDKNIDDAMIYLKAENKNFSFYISPIYQNGKYSFVIDSLNFERRFIYLRRIKK